MEHLEVGIPLDAGRRRLGQPVLERVAQALERFIPATAEGEVAGEVVSDVGGRRVSRPEDPGPEVECLTQQGVSLL